MPRLDRLITCRMVQCDYFFSYAYQPCKATLEQSNLVITKIADTILYVVQ